MKMKTKKPILELYDDFDDSDDALFYYDNFKEELGELLKTKNPAGDWHIRGEFLGWDNRSGSKIIRLNNPNDSNEFLSELLPDADITLKIYHNTRYGLTIKCYHHDSPTGEYYYCRKYKGLDENE